MTGFSADARGIEASNFNPQASGKLQIPSPNAAGWRRSADLSRFAGLYRRFVIGSASRILGTQAYAHGPQTASLRYSRLQICATTKVPCVLGACRLKLP